MPAKLLWQVDSLQQILRADLFQREQRGQSADVKENASPRLMVKNGSECCRP